MGTPDPYTGVATKQPVGAVLKEDDYGDATLFAKKLYAAVCPASIFTGKMRLYVQALYGLPLYNYKSLAKGGKRVKSSKNPVNRPFTELLNETSAAPALMLRPYVASDDFKLDPEGNPTTELNEYTSVLIDTSSGVYLDPQTGQHWLIRINNQNVNIYPLISNKCGEALRKHLITEGKVEKLLTSSEDREHLEAYILAWSLPDVKNVQKHPGAAPCGAYSMGYGWHWNWSGTRADIVLTESASRGPYDGTMKSQHNSLTVTIRRATAEEIRGGAPRQTWGLGFNSIEAAEWAVLRACYCIVEPNFGTGYLAKTTPRASTQRVCDAPFYAFYRKDELVVARVRVTRIPPAPGFRRMSPGFANSYTPGAQDVTSHTFGTEDGFLDDVSPTGEVYVTKFSAGGVSTPDLPYSITEVSLRAKVSGKTMHEILGPAWSNQTDFYGRLMVGRIDSPTYITLGDPDHRYTVNESYFRRWTWTYEKWNEYSQYTTAAEIVVPFFDSEAIYLDANASTFERRDEHYKWTCESVGRYGWMKVIYATPNVENGATSVYELLGGHSGIASTGSPLEYVPQREFVTPGFKFRKLVCSSGTFDHKDVVTGNQWFHANTEPEVESQFATYSATSTVSPSVYSWQTGVSVGMTIPGVSTFVGWV